MRSDGRKRAAILISGRGSNLAALIKASGASDYPAKVALVISDRSGAAGLRLAEANDIPAVTVERHDFATSDAFEARLTDVLRQAAIDIVCLAGFMRILSPAFVETWRDRMLNIHPALLPAFPGLRTHERALAAGVKLHGATVHFVRAEVDCGPIVAQGAAPVLCDDTPETLAARVLAVEHRLYPLALHLVASGAARVVGDSVVIEAHGETAQPLLWPPG